MVPLAKKKFTKLSALSNLQGDNVAISVDNTYVKKVTNKSKSANEFVNKSINKTGSELGKKTKSISKSVNKSILSQNVIMLLQYNIYIIFVFIYIFLIRTRI